jgi:hypothetical protein
MRAELSRPQVNANGSVGNIAGVMSEDGNVFGLMPHPEAASENFWAATTVVYFPFDAQAADDESRHNANSGFFNTNADEVDIAYTSPDPGPRI